MKEKSIKIITIIVFAVCLVFALCACTTIPDKYDITIAGDIISDKGADVITSELPEEIVNEPTQSGSKQYLATVIDSTGAVKKIQYDYDETIVYPIVERVGYNFTGWKIVVDGVVGANFTLTKMPDYNITCQAQWEIKRFTVNFIIGADVHLISGTLVQTVDWGRTVRVPDLNKPGYRLTGWTGGDITAPVTANIEFTPVWEINIYTVTFNIGEGKRVGGGELVQQVEHGKKFILPVVERVGYTYQFGSYILDDNDSEVFIPIDENTVVTGVMNYVVRYTLKQYTVIFKNYDGSTLFVKQIGHGLTVTADNPTRIGYTFSGWDKPLTNITGDTTINAVWKLNTFNVTFEPVGGTVSSGSLAQSIEFEKSASIPVLTKVGYTFDGWQLVLSNVTLNDGGTAYASRLDYVTSDIVATAKWKIKTYTVTFKDFDNKTLGSVVVNHGATATAVSSPTRTGYTFANWDKTLINITGDTVITAIYTINHYTITWDPNGGTFVQ